MNTTFSKERFQRQLNLKKFDEVTQQKLCNAKVLIIGAGGLGCPAIQYLSAIGIGHLGIVDGDDVVLSNLHRQVLYNENDIGKLKTACVKEKIALQNKEIICTIYATLIDQHNILEIIRDYDVILDCTDNFLARYIINDACLLLQKPLVFGAVFQYEGQVAVFNVDTIQVNYRDLFPSTPTDLDAPNCETAGVFNMATGIIGIMQAAEAIKIISGIGDILSNKLATYNTLRNEIYTIVIEQNKQGNRGPSTLQEFASYDYNLFCGIKSSHSDEIDAMEFDALLDRNDTQIIDIRNQDEFPEVKGSNVIKVPLSTLKENRHRLDSSKKIVLFCHTGIRTISALELLQDEFDLQHVKHLKGGIVKWIDYKSKTR